MAVAVELSGPGEVDSVQTLWLEMLEHHRRLARADWPVREASQSWAMCRKRYLRWLGDDVAIMLIARRPREVPPVGYLVCEFEPSGPTFDWGDRVANVHSLAVTAGARGEGVGTALLEACRAELRKRRIAHWTIGVIEGNEGALALYRRLGFDAFQRELVSRVDDRP